MVKTIPEANAYAKKRVAYLEMSRLTHDVASKLSEYANDPEIIELALIDSNAGAFRGLADAVRQEAANWEAIHQAIATMDADRPEFTRTVDTA